MTQAVRRWNKHRALQWLRKMHGWIGLWGATLGLLFGFTGILMNHRAVLKIPAAQTEENNFQIALPQPAPDSAKAMAQWLRTELAQSVEATRVKEDPPKPVAWGDKSLKQPARWSAAFSNPRSNVQAEYWVGNNYVSVKRSDSNLFATLNNFHKGNGLGIGWVLLADTLAGSIILLSLSGVMLWTQFHRRRVIGVAIATTPIVIGAVFAMQSL